MLKHMKAHWKRAVSGLLAVIMAAGMLPASALAADTGGSSNPYAPTGSFELNVAGATAWNDGNEALTVYKTEGGSTQATTIPAAVPFALLEDKGGDRLKIGYQNGGWTGANLDGTGWVDKDSVLVNLPDILPSITYDRDSGKLFNSRLTRFEYIVPGSYALAEQLAQLQQEAMSGGETLVVRQSGQTVSVSRAKGDPAQLHSYSLNGVTYQKYDIWTEYEAANDSLSDLSYDLPYVIDRAYSADPSVTLTMFCPQTVKRAPSKVSASDPTGGVGAYNPGSPGGKKPTTSNVDWSVDHERTFLRFTLIEFPQGVVTDLNTRDWGTWHVVGTPLNVIWSNGWSVDQCRRDITWYNSSAMQYNGEGTNAAQLMGGSFESGGVYSYDATGGSNSRWVTTADEFQKATGISDQQKEQMFHCNSSSWSTGWTDNDYTSMWGTDAEFVTPGNLYKVYKANDAFLYLLNCLSTTDAGSGWSKDEAMERWSEYVHDADGNLRTKYRIIVETGAVVKDPDGHRRAYTLREMMAYSIYNNEGAGRYTLIYDQSSTMVNMARWMRQGKDNQFVEYPLDENGTPTGEELHSTNGFRECDSYVDTIQYARPMRDTIFNERRSFGLHIFSPFNFESQPTGLFLEVTKKADENIPAGQEWGFTVKYTAGSPSKFSATKNGTDCTAQVTDTGSGLKFKLKADETIRIDFDADPSFRCEVTEDDSSKLTGITGTGGTTDMTAKKFTSTSSAARVTFTNGTEPPPPPPDEPDPGKAILFKRDANTNKGVGPATFKFSSVTNGVYEFDTNASGELETIQWWDPTEKAGKYIKPGEYAVSEIVPPPNYESTTEVQQIKLELDADGNPIPAGPLVFKNLSKVGLRVVKYDRQSHTPMNGVTFEIFRNGTSIGRYETKGQGEILLTGIEPGTYRAVEVDTGDEGHIMDGSYQEVELVAGGGTKELVFFNDNKPGMKLVKVDSADPSKAIPNVKFRIEAVDGSYGPEEFTTNGSGEIDLSNLPTGSYVVTEVECPGYVVDEAQRVIHLRANDTAQFVFTNTKKPGFKLIKTSADGTPLDGVTFKITPIEDASHSIDRTTQNGGEISVEGLEPGVYSVQETATLPDHILDKTEYHVELSPGKVAELRIKNDKRPNLTIWKKDADTGAVVPNTVFLVKAADGHSVNEVRTGPDGKGTLENLLPGVYEISEKSVPEPWLRDADSQLVTLYPNRDREVLFENHKRPELTIFKVDSVAGAPIEGAKFHVTYTSNGEAAGAPASMDFGYFISDSHGEIRLHEKGKKLYPGEFTVTEVEPAPGFQMKEPTTQKVILHGGESKTLTFQNEPLNGIVVEKYDSVTHETLPGCTFQLRFLGGTSGTGGTIIGQKTTGQNGTCIWTGLTAGTYIVEEIDPADGYSIINASETVYLADSGVQSVVTVSFDNAPDGILLIRKVCSVNPSITLQDAEFKVTYADGTLIGDSNGIYRTDAHGEIRIEGLKPGKSVIVTETKAPAGFIIDTQSQTVQIKEGRTVSLTFKNQPRGKLIIQKRDSQTNDPLPGAEFRVTTAAGCEVGLDGVTGTATLTQNGLFTTDSNGEIRISNLAPGAYVLTETKAPAGYVMDSPSTNVVIGPNGDTQTVIVTNTRKGGLIVEKYDSVTKQPLFGAQFKITNANGELVPDNEGLTSSNGLYTTNREGQIVLSKLIPGTYVVAEVTAPDNYRKDPTPQTVVVNAGDTQTIRFYDDPLCTLTILKRDAVTKKPLKGAEFLVRDSSGHVIGPNNGLYTTGTDGTVTVSGLAPNSTVVVSEKRAPKGYILDETPKNIVVRTGVANSLIFDNEPGTTLIIRKFVEGTENEPLSGVCFKVVDGSGAAVGPDDGCYYTDKAGEIVLEGIEPGTTVKVREIKTVEGFVLDGTPQDILIKGGEVQQLTFWNKRAGTLVIQKKDSVTGAFIPGAQFQLTYANGGFVDADNGHLSSNGLYTTDDKGEIRISGIVGTIVAKEIKAAPGYVIDQSTQTQTVTVNPLDTQTLTFLNEPMCSLTIKKVDSVTGKPVPNTEFTVKDGSGNILARCTTGKDGTATVTGLVPGSTVVVTETRVPEGYVLNQTPQTITVKNGTGNTVVSGNVGGSSGGNGSSNGNDLTFENDPKMTLTIHKYIEGTANEPLAGVAFKVVDGSGAPVGPSDGVFYTDAKGEIVIEGLEPGTTVTAQEVKTVEGFVLDGTPKTIKIKAGQAPQLIFWNKRAGNLIINKVDGIDKHPLAGVCFKLTYADGSNVDQDGGKTSTNGIYVTDANGQIRISGIVGTVIITELETVDGYYIKEENRTQTVQVNPDDTQTVTVYNVPTQALVIQKFAAGDKGTPLAGVEFLVTDSDGTVIGPNNGIYKTDVLGRITIKGLTPGTVITAKETKALDGYILDSTPQSIEIKSGEVQTLSFYNTPAGGLTIIKKDEETGERISGVQFEIRKLNGEIIGTYTTDRSGVISLPQADTGWYQVTELKAAKGYRLDSQPYQVEVKDGSTATLEITNRQAGSAIIHKVDSLTGEGIYEVKFLVSDSNGNPIGTYESDNEGYVFIDKDLADGKYTVRELECAQGYILDTVPKTFYVEYGGCTTITWPNTAIRGQIQIVKKSAEYNSVNGLPAGTLLEGATFEIYNERTGNKVDTIVTGANGLASSKALPLGRYTIRETKAPANYGTSTETYTAVLEYSGQIVRLEISNKSLSTGVSIEKTGPKEAMSGQPVRYVFSRIGNTSNVMLQSFYWRDTLPASVRLDKVVTGTYNFPGTYKIVYKVNSTGDYRTLADSLSTSRNYTLAASPAALGLAANEQVTEVMFVFGQVPGGFSQVEAPMLHCITLPGLVPGSSFVNVADVGGTYNGVWVQGVTRWVTTVYGKPTPLPRTGY